MTLTIGKHCIRALLLPLVLAALPLIPAVAQTLETETARLLARKAVKFGANFEYQRSSDGRARKTGPESPSGFPRRQKGGHLVSPPDIAFTGVRWLSGSAPSRD